MKLLIVESPAKATTIEKYIGKEFKVASSVGHIRDLPKSNKKAVDIENDFKPTYEISKGKEKVIKILQDFSKKADEVYLATDPDREGEAIAWHLKEALKLKTPKRVTFHEITKEAVLEAMRKPRTIDMNLKTAQEARRVLDRLVGYDLSGLIWKKVRYGLSAGRVQSPALRILVEREREIRDFKPETYFIITADFKSKANELIVTEYSKKLKTKAEVDKILETAKKTNFEIKSVEESETKRQPKPPFTTSTLQQTASTRLGFSPSRTMSIAQKLYEAGFITYMRTDSVNLSKQALTESRKAITSEFGESYFVPRVFKTKSKNAQEAHEAIRPSKPTLRHAGRTPEQKSLYDLIWKRLMTSQMSEAIIFKTKIKIQGKDIPEPFVINGSRLKYDGWLKADPDSRGDDVELPKVLTGEKTDLEKIESEEKQTEPPPRYSEAGLVKELEKRDIGRPSTYASIIKTLEIRGYVTKENKSLKPTDTGEVVSGFLEDNFAEYISDSFTAEMENKLDEIADGKREYAKTLKDFYTPFTKAVRSKEKIEKITNLGDAPAEFKCPKCESRMIIKLGKNGKFLSCDKYPDCAGARMINGKELAGPKEIGEKCPKCETGKLVIREGRFGEFVSCSNYPKCKYIKKDAIKPESSSVKCPNCGEKTGGEIVKRRGRFGEFWSCINYPDCKFAMKAKPTGKNCDKCGALMMQGTKTIPERCSVKTCSNHNPHKL